MKSVNRWQHLFAQGDASDSSILLDHLFQFTLAHMIYTNALWCGEPKKLDNELRCMCDGLRASPPAHKVDTGSGTPRRSTTLLDSERMKGK